MAQEEGMSFRQLIRNRLLVEMLRGAKVAAQADWQVLIVDEYTTKIMSSTCRMAELTEEGVSLVEDLNKKRQPQPLLDAVYFIQPSTRSLRILEQDMGGSKALYRRVHVFFSSPVSNEILQSIKDNIKLRERMAGLKEMNLEISTVDIQGFVTDQDNALVELFAVKQSYERCIDVMATRLATVFASLKEFPAVRYRAAKTSSTESGTPARARDLVSTKLAAAVWDRLLKYKAKLPGFPHKDTCDLLIVDRSVDPVTPVIHDWSYGGLAFDVLEEKLDGNRYTLEVNTESGKTDKRVVILDEHDSMWMELRDLFIAEALEKVTTLASKIVAKRSQKELSTRELKEAVATLGKYSELKDKVDLHVSIAGTVMETVKNENLMEIGLLEQGFVFGDSTATYKELANQYKLHKDEMSAETKVRLLGVYAATHPEKFDPSRRTIWKNTAEIPDREMRAVMNLDLLGVKASNESQAKTTLTFGKRSAKAVLREERNTSDSGWKLMRFYPAIHDLLDDMNSDKLDKEAYPYVQEPKGGSESRQVASMRGGSSSGSQGSWAGKSRRTTGSSSAASDPGAGSVNVPKGRRLFVFIIGGMTRSELRVAHVLSTQLKREVIVGSSWLETPTHFLDKLRDLAED